MSGPFGVVADRWREQLVALGFADDGERLQGPVRWSKPAPDGEATEVFTARVEVTPGPTFPFAPPQVTILNAGGPLEVTFHIDTDGLLCLWEDDWAADQAPWLNAQTLVDRIGHWLRDTAAGWPGDDSCDLERYLSHERDDDRLVLYDATMLVVDRAVRTAPGPTPDTIVITNQVRQTGDIVSARRLRRKDHRLAWVADIGIAERPVRVWDDIATALGPRANEVNRLISMGVVTVLLLLYTRGTTPAALAVRVRRTAAGIRVTACESADTSVRTRTMRAGRAAAGLADVPVAIVGCGAIGSFTAELLFRSGVRHLTLLDAERLRPGNAVRHLAGVGHVGRPKAHAVRNCLAAIGPDVTTVRAYHGRLTDLDEASALVLANRVVLDATGSGRASSLLATAATLIAPEVDHSVVSACVQRDGDVLRVDRMPLRSGENHLPALELVDDATHLRERGCGSPVSPTPPGAVVAAAELAHRVVIDEATERTLPATLVDVRTPQDQPPFNRTGWLFSDLPRRAAS